MDRYRLPPKPCLFHNRNTVRHQLSAEREFVRMPRGLLDPGRGQYWTYQASAPPKPRRKSGKGDPSSSVEPRELVIEPTRRMSSSKKRPSVASPSHSPHQIAHPLPRVQQVFPAKRARLQSPAYQPAAYWQPQQPVGPPPQTMVYRY